MVNETQIIVYVGMCQTETKMIDLAKWINEITGNKTGVVYKPRRDWDKVTRRRESIDKAKSIL